MRIINKYLGILYYKLKQYERSLLHLRKIVFPNEYKIFISYSRLNSNVVHPFAINALLKNHPIYIDISGKPHQDSHSIEVGLSEALANCKVLIAFISKEYLMSKWCRGELREFIFIYGKKLTLEEINKIKEIKQPSLFHYDQLNIFELPKVPILLVFIDDGITGDCVSKAISPEIPYDDIYRIIISRGEEEPAQYKLALDYVMNRGIDASKYIKEIKKIKLDRNNISLSYENIFQKIEMLLSKNEKQTLTGFPKLDETQLWNYIWSKYPYKSICHDINIKHLLEGLNFSDDIFNLRVRSFS